MCPRSMSSGWRSWKIRDRKSRKLVTVIEVLSPANKRPGPDRDQYVVKRQQLLGSLAQLLEIDLLQGGAQRGPLSWGVREISPKFPR